MPPQNNAIEAFDCRQAEPAAIFARIRAISMTPRRGRPHMAMSSARYYAAPQRRRCFHLGGLRWRYQSTPWPGRQFHVAAASAGASAVAHTITAIWPHAAVDGD